MEKEIYNLYVTRGYGINAFLEVAKVRKYWDGRHELAEDHPWLGESGQVFNENGSDITTDISKACAYTRKQVLRGMNSALANIATGRQHLKDLERMENNASK